MLAMLLDIICSVISELRKIVISLNWSRYSSFRESVLLMKLMIRVPGRVRPVIWNSHIKRRSLLLVHLWSAARSNLSHWPLELLSSCRSSFSTCSIRHCFRASLPEELSLIGRFSLMQKMNY